MANAVSFSGLGSGIDFSQITESIINQRSRPLQLLQTRRTLFQARIDAFKNLNAKIISFRETARSLTSETAGTERAALISNPTVATATASAAAPLGSTSINVTRLASAFAQATNSFNSQTDAVLKEGSTFELRASDGSRIGNAIAITADNNSLNGLRDAINAEGAGKVAASVIDIKGDGTEFQLVLNSAATGAKNRVELVQTVDPATNSGANPNWRALNPPGSAPDYTQLDAALTINNLFLTRPSNSISDAVSGVTLELKATGATSVTVGADAAPLKEKIKAFVESYNAIQDAVATQYAPDKNGRPSGALAGDATLRQMQTDLRTALGSAAANNGGAFRSLADIGMTRDANGKLQLNESELDAKLASNPADVQALLHGKTATDTGLAEIVLATTARLGDEITGTLQTAITGYQTTISGIDKSIADGEDRLELLRLSLQKQFAAVDAAIGQLNSQGTALTNIIKSLQPRN